MCGIVGYIGSKDCSQILLSGLRRLEYRGYDSAGIAIGTQEGDVRVCRAKGKLDELFAAYHEDPFDGRIGMGHTRWATHGRPSQRNAHPHVVDDVVVAHNGIIENYTELKQQLEAEGRQFHSDTDTEVIAHLIAASLSADSGSLHGAVRSALARVEGSYALVVMEMDAPDRLVVARNASPMVLGCADGDVYAASDIPAILPYTREFTFLEDGQTAVLREGQMQVYGPEGEPVDPPTKTINWDPASAEKQGYKHFMLKEIHEQPARIVDTLRGRVDRGGQQINLEELGVSEQRAREATQIVLLACGTSHYATHVAKYLLERFADIAVDIELASEFRYRSPVVDERTIAVAVSQSGETADTLAAIRRARQLGAYPVSIVNVLESTIARESEGVLYTHAGPEIGVASTKAFTTQLTAFAMFAIWLGRVRGELDESEATESLKALRKMPNKLDELLSTEEDYEQFAPYFSNTDSVLYLGRGILYPIALEGALKLKEISYIHAEGYAAGEMKHGPIALIEETFPVVVVAPQNRLYDKVMSNLEEVKAREGDIIAIATEGDERMASFADRVLEIPEGPEFLQPILAAVSVQLLAYYVADFKGTDVDQPRNLAKSVTVE